MGRSRRRARTAASSPSPTASRAAAAPRTAAVSPGELRKTLGAYLAGAIALAILVLLATVALAATLAPWIVLVVDGAAAVGLHRWAQGRLAGLSLSDEDRVLQTLAGGLLVLVFAFAAVAAVVLTVA